MKQDTRNTLLQAGYDSFIEHGYNGAGLNDILKRAGVPKGSFYHYFNTKELFLIEVLKFYEEAAGEQLMAHVNDNSKPSLEQFKSYIESMVQKCDSDSCFGGCLIGNMAQEMADNSEDIRVAVQSSMNAWKGGIEQFFVLAQEQGDICKNHNTGELANMFVDGWQGALLRMKVEKTTEPLNRFLSTFLKLLSLKGDAS